MVARTSFDKHHGIFEGTPHIGYERNMTNVGQAEQEFIEGRRTRDASRSCFTAAGRTRTCAGTAAGTVALARGITSPRGIGRDNGFRRSAILSNIRGDSERFEALSRYSIHFTHAQRANVAGIVCFTALLYVLSAGLCREIQQWNSHTSSYNVA